MCVGSGASRGAPWPLVVAGFLIFHFLTALAASADQSPALEQAAAKLQAATVTVRFLPADPLPENREGRPESRARVTVSSGVSLGDGLLVTHLTSSSADGRIRITIPSGEQAQARARVVDHYSGLALLETDNRDIPALSLAETSPKVGAWVLSAAAWGIEKPVVSLGILSGRDRAIRDAIFPPLLQCDLRAAETSAGAPVVDQQGRLIGVVVASDADDRSGRWTYAVPVSHVRRLLAAKSDESVIVLRRRRPVVGLVLEAGKTTGSVVVQRVTQGGPADRAGINVGDQVLAADGLTIRSVYQVVVPLLKKQPGDKMIFLVQQPTGRRTIQVTLGGGVEMPVQPLGQHGAEIVQPRVRVERVGPRRFDLKGTRGTVRNLSVGPVPEAKPPGPDERIGLLEKTVTGYGTVIQRLQEELRRRDQVQAEYTELIRSLKTQVAALQQQLEEANQVDSGSRPPSKSSD